MVTYRSTRPGIELATVQSQVQRPNHLSTVSPITEKTLELSSVVLPAPSAYPVSYIHNIHYVLFTDISDASPV